MFKRTEGLILHDDRSRPRRLPVVVVHGYLATPVTNAPITARLRRDGFRTYNVDLPGLNTQDMRRSADVLAARVEDVKQRTGAAQVSLIGISMGGLIAAWYVRRREGHLHVRRTLTLASPLAGTRMASLGHALSAFQSRAAQQMHPEDPFIRELHEEPHPPADIVSFAVAGDPMVPPDAARLPGAKHVVSPYGRWPFGHYYIVLDPRNYELVRDELLRD